jgi:alkylation response protein AidB-like acyl-CoA dehydrogenase
VATEHISRTYGLLERVNAVCRERIAPRAARFDREAAHPRENWDDLWREGCLGLLIPAEYGGLDVAPATYTAVLERIAQACASTAMTVNMHSLTARIIATLGSPEPQARYFRPVIQQGKLLTAWSSEGRISLTRTYLVSRRDLNPACRRRLPGQRNETLLHDGRRRRVLSRPLPA